MMEELMELSDFNEPGTIIETGDPDLVKFLVGGTLIEYINNNGKRKVLRFFNLAFILVPLYPESIIESIGVGCCIMTLTRKQVMRLLRTEEEVRDSYRHVKRNYLESVREYNEDLETKTPGERYCDLIQDHPWVLEMINQEDLASYLNISLTQYQKMIQVN